MPRISPTTLSQRLKELADLGVVEQVQSERGAVYSLTALGTQLESVVHALHKWGREWASEHGGPDPEILMTDIQEQLDLTCMATRRSTVRFRYHEMPPQRRDFWLVVDEKDAFLCSSDPGLDVDLDVRTTVETLAAIWAGRRTLKHELLGQRISFEGNQLVASSIRRSLERRTELWKQAA